MAVLAIGLAGFVRYNLKPFFGTEGPFVAFTLSVALAAWYGGFGPGLLATGLGALVGVSLFIEPYGSLAIAHVADCVRVGAFITIGAIISALSQMTHSARSAAEASAERLLASEHRASRILDTASEGIWISDRECRITFANQCMAEMLGSTVDGIVGRQLTDFIFEEDEEAFWQRMTRRRSGTGDRFDARYRRPDGSTLWALVSSTPFMSDDGTYDGALVMVTDITDRKEAEDTLRAREERFRGLVEHARDAITLLGADGTILYESPAAERLLGYPPEERLGKSGIDWVHPEDKPEAARAFEECINAAAGSSTVIEMRFRHQDGSWRLSEVTGTNLLNLASVGGVVVNWRDVTTERTLEQQLRQSQKMDAIGRLAGGVAHDFNNMLAVILGYTELSMGAIRPDDPLRPGLTQVKRAAERAASLTRQLLAFGRKQVLQSRLLDLNGIVSGTEGMLRRLIREDIELVTHLQPQLGPVTADAGQLEQVILNLAVNARDAMPQGGRLTLETRGVELHDTSTHDHEGVEPGQYVLLSVSDTGCGMDPETQARIFEPFFTTKSVGEGTGLGLATVYGIVKQSGGHVEVCSEEGHGTTFKVYLPLADASSADITRRSPDDGDGRGVETVLILEDDEQVRGVVQALLAGRGYRVLVADRPEHALAICRKHGGPIDLLVSDVVMPGMGGPELATTLVGERPEMRVLFMSGYTDDTVLRHGVLTAEVAFIQKPFTPQALALKVQEVLRMKPRELVRERAEAVSRV